MLVALLCAAQIPRSEVQIEHDMQQRQMKALNLQRQQEIRKDTDRLFQLATELKAAVDKSNENMLSLDVVRKADEVEKLAKQVKEKMKEGAGPVPHMEPPPPPRFPGRPPR
jgi:hypothetical protein